MLCLNHLRIITDNTMGDPESEKTKAPGTEELAAVRLQRMVMNLFSQMVPAKNRLNPMGCLMVSLAAS
jgi:hypothetical protein